MSKKFINIIETILISIIISVCLILILGTIKITAKIEIINILNDIFKNKTGFILCLLLPFLFIFVLEVIKINKEARRKELEKQMTNHLEELEKIKTNSKIKETIVETIKNQIEEIKGAKEDFDKINKLEKTIQIPMGEIEKQIKKLNNELDKKTEKKSKVEDDTVILFSKDDIKEAVKKELETVSKEKTTKATKTVENPKNAKKEPTKTVDKNKSTNKKSTTTVKKTKSIAKKSTKTVENTKPKKTKSTKVVEKK